MKQGDITIQGQAVVLPVNKIIVITRDLTLASGAQIITGVGFKPSSLICFAGLTSGSIRTSWQMEDGTNRGGVYNNINDLMFATSTNYIAIFDDNTANQQYCVLSSFDTDGMTISWTKTGIPTGTGTLIFMFFK